MSNLPQDNEESLFNPGLSSFSSDSSCEPSLRDHRSEIRAIKFAMAEQGQTMAQHGQLLTSLSAQLSQLVDIFSATPSAVPPTPAQSPPSGDYLCFFHRPTELLRFSRASRSLS